MGVTIPKLGVDVFKFSLYMENKNYILLKNDNNSISLQERACKETKYPQKRQICEPIVLDKTSNNMQLCMRKWIARWWER